MARDHRQLQRSGERNDDARNGRLAAVAQAVAVRVDEDESAEGVLRRPELFAEVILRRDHAARKIHPHEAIVLDRSGLRRSWRVVAVDVGERLRLADRVQAIRQVAEDVRSVRARHRGPFDGARQSDRDACNPRLARIDLPVLVRIDVDRSGDRVRVGRLPFAEVVLDRVDAARERHVFEPIGCDGAEDGRPLRFDAIQVTGGLRLGDRIAAVRQFIEHVRAIRAGLHDVLHGTVERHRDARQHRLVRVAEAVVVAVDIDESADRVERRRFEFADVERHEALDLIEAQQVERQQRLDADGVGRPNHVDGDRLIQVEHARRQELAVDRDARTREHATVRLDVEERVGVRQRRGRGDQRLERVAASNAASNASGG